MVSAAVCNVAWDVPVHIHSIHRVALKYYIHRVKRKITRARGIVRIDPFFGERRGSDAESSAGDKSLDIGFRSFFLGDRPDVNYVFVPKLYGRKSTLVLLFLK